MLRWERGARLQAVRRVGLGWLNSMGWKLHTDGVRIRPRAAAPRLVTDGESGFRPQGGPNPEEQAPLARLLGEASGRLSPTFKPPEQLLEAGSGGYISSMR